MTETKLEKVPNLSIHGWNRNLALFFQDNFLLLIKRSKKLLFQKTFCSSTRGYSWLFGFSSGSGLSFMAAALSV